MTPGTPTAADFDETSHRQRIDSNLMDELVKLHKARRRVLLDIEKLTEQRKDLKETLAKIDAEVEETISRREEPHLSDQ